MDLSKKLQNLDELENDFSEQLDLHDLYNFSELNAEELSEVTPLLNSLCIDRKRYGEVLESFTGGEKRVDRVHDFCAGRDVALATPLKNENELDYEDFLREARITSRLQHPNIMSIHDIGLDENKSPYFTMDFISGQSLALLLKDRGNNKNLLNERLGLFQKVCDAIAYAHSRGVIHLDLKPENINVGSFGEVVVYDWGLAKIIDQRIKVPEQNESSEELDMLNDVTLSGQVKGTPGYLAPEQIGDDCEKSKRSDVYALGAILYAILTGHPPISADNMEDLIRKTKQGIISGAKETYPDQFIPSSLSAVCMKALSRDPEERYTSVEELQNEIVKYQHGFATEAEHASTWMQLKLLMKRHQKTFSITMTFLLVLICFGAFSFVRISHEKNQALAAQSDAEENFFLYKTENELKQKLDKDLRSLVHQSSLGGHYETTRIMIESVDKALLDPESQLDKNQLLSFKGDLHFTLQEFNKAAAAYSESNPILYEISSEYARIKVDDATLLSNRQLGDLLESFITSKYKYVAYQTFYYHVLRSENSDPQSYTKAVKNLLDLLNNKAHWLFAELTLSRGNEFNHLDLSEAPYQIFILPIATEEPYNVLACLDINSIDFHGSDFSDFERLLGLRLEVLDIRQTKLGHEKIKLMNEKLGLKKLIIEEGQFENDRIKQLAKYVEIEIVLAGKRIQE
ncbi:serine/threonine-protein kinase [Lentisphaera profundi]|uniref:Serine/threonine-protein kinase n=1 Tax=Lentisphaera profundi TaxID=1658616 RepID=A0ABY7VTG7_9BACT|nr:serine/threonine-protein kinase [Lentisphaera profundi]WDE96520.1 serine/threonine-protein kinase [Lentisphaera profundi]